MPDPTRPVAGAPIDTDWGQQIHDRVFQPKGVRVAGAPTAVTSSFTQLDMSSAVDDPGGWLASDTLTVPTGGGGLYSYSLNVLTDNGDAGERTKVQLRVNGASVIGWFIEQNGATAEFDGKSGLLELAAGDEVEVFAVKTGGPNPDVQVRALDLLIQGTSIGA